MASGSSSAKKRRKAERMQFVRMGLKRPAAIRLGLNMGRKQSTAGADEAASEAAAKPSVAAAPATAAPAVLRVKSSEVEVLRAEEVQSRLDVEPQPAAVPGRKWGVGTEVENV